MENKTITSKSLWIFAFILSLGFVISAAVIGYALKQSNRSQNSISVKGLSEKPIKADSARWEINVQTPTASNSIPEAYQLLDQNLKTLQAFFVEQGFKATDLQQGNKSSQAYYEEVQDEEGKTRREFRGYIAMQSIVISSRDIQKIEKAAKNAYLLDEKGLSIEQKPEYLVSNLEEIKMSLIANATQNAHSRANEFAKVGGVKVGTMRSASQGAFYILPESGSDDDSDYGGAYDKATINKIARVVVTINYAID
ncbi:MULTISPECIES: SIMPL domain-containing protein [Acinetobacter]|uniref:SIMPL domain-containing protein n=1 Tax=Acinetobacter wuhouensis TaxID=1879050 RepID=A0A4V2DN78_9GAMM|nr:MULTISPECIES: SIMPL domain-containing protein [Acinetobacter]RZG47209.1 SIMPL domain-containing protein [Acinetobacter wuhouensis]RZG81521.1 SIMPL domain-containing protein [Acinetobacter sp. WCHAc060033]